MHKKYRHFTFKSMENTTYLWILYKFYRKRIFEDLKSDTPFIEAVEAMPKETRTFFLTPQRIDIQYYKLAGRTVKMTK
jgi:hypothetical protein